VIHRRWEGSRAAALSQNGNLSIVVQREPDEYDEPIPYAVVTTVKMPGVNEIYAQVRAQVAVQPKVQVTA
jgi:hypothetical protein